MDALLRRRSMIAAGGGSPTPPGPTTTMPYIRGGSDGSYIDTGITADNTVKIIVWARNVNPSADGWSHIFGSRSDSSSNQLVVALPYTANMGKIFVGYANTSAYSSDAFEYLSGYHKYELYGGSLSVDDVIVATASANSFSNSQNIYLFGVNSGGTLAQCRLPVDICACKIYKNNVLVRDYTAVNSPSVGLFDSISNTLFTNAGNGSFTYGTFNSSAYVPLEYVESAGASYFDAGLKGSQDLNYVCKYRMNATTDWPALFGCQTSSSSKRYGITFGDSTVVGRYIYFLYNSAAKSYNNSSTMNGSDYVAVKSGVNHYLYLNNTQKTSKTHSSATFTTDYNIYVGAFMSGGNVGSPFEGRLYYLRLGSERNFVPAKVSGVAGMYDTYNDVFYPSGTNTNFVAGPEL